jgi:hypothetical protein
MIGWIRNHLYFQSRDKEVGFPNGKVRRISRIVQSTVSVTLRAEVYSGTKRLYLRTSKSFDLFSESEREIREFPTRPLATTRTFGRAKGRSGGEARV